MAKREFELDLTSVCVATGVLQLPMKMQEYFRSGDLSAVVDGEELLVRFTEPRRLAGFKEHFERRGLRCNDRVQFQVEVADSVAVRLVAASVKRERSRPTTQHAGTPAGTAERSAPATSHGEAGNTARASSWGNEELGGQVRAVRRVRIEGAAPLPVSGPTRFRAESGGVRQHASDPHPVRSGPAQDQASAGAGAYARWAPLDGVSSSTFRAPAAELDFAETTVREIRRSKRTTGTFDDLVVGAGQIDTASAVAEDAVPDEVGYGADFPPLYSHGDEVVEDPPAVTAMWSTEPPIEPAAAPAAVPASRAGETMGAETRSGGHVATPRIPVPRNTAVGADWQPTPAADLDLGDVASAPRQPRLIDERELVPVHAPFESPATPEPLTAERGVPHTTPSQELRARSEPVDRPSGASAPAPSHAIDDSDFGGEYLPAGGALESALRAKQQERLAFDPDAQPPTPGRGSTWQGGDATADARTTGAQRTTGQAPAEPVAVSGGGDRSSLIEAGTPVAPRIEDDLRLVQNYLSRPNTPAIVRSEVIAAELGIDDQRSERALERLSEDRDRVSRIRKGAYMVKSMPPGHSHRL